MALKHSTVTVGTTPTLLTTVPAGTDIVAALIFNNDNSAIYIGDNTVATSGVNQGIQINKSTSSTQIWLHAGDALYAVSAAGTTANAVTILYSSVF